MAYCEEDIAEVLFTAKQIAQRVTGLAEQVAADYQGHDLVLVGILTGSFVFLADFMRQLNRPCEVDFFDVSSYGDGTVSRGEASIIKDLTISVAGKCVLIVEDIVDTGRTLAKLVALVAQRKPASVKVCTLLNKPARREVNVELSYVGFEIPDLFVVGYGMDLAQHYRDLPYIAVLKQSKYAPAPNVSKNKKE